MLLWQKVQIINNNCLYFALQWFSPSAFGLLKKGFELIELQSINILRIIAITEIFILIIIPFSLLSFSFRYIGFSVLKNERKHEQLMSYLTTSFLITVV